jgi:hypothetical protein
MEDAISMSFQNFLWMRRSPRALIAKGCFISSHEELVKDTSRALGAEKPGAKKLAPGGPPRGYQGRRRRPAHRRKDYFTGLILVP